MGLDGIDYLLYGFLTTIIYHHISISISSVSKSLVGMSSGIEFLFFPTDYLRSKVSSKGSFRSFFGFSSPSQKSSSSISSRNSSVAILGGSSFFI